MKFKDILKGAAAIAGTLHPGIGAAIGLVNGFLPEDKKLPETATGADVEAAVKTLPPDVQAILMEKEIDLQIAQEEGWTERYKAMCSADGQETRAKIVTQMAWAFTIPYIGLGIAATYHIAANNPELGDMWLFIASYLGIPMVVIKAYFGILTSEQSNRLNGANNLPASPTKGIMDMFKR